MSKPTKSSPSVRVGRRARRLGLALAGFACAPRIWAFPALCMLGGATAFTLALAAEVPRSEAELQALIDRAQARAAAASGSIAVWALTLERRGDAYEGDARALADQNHAKVAQGLGMMDDPALKAAGAMGPVPATQGALYVAVSLSMPPQALRALAEDAGKAHVQVVIRGLEGGSFKTTLEKIRTVFDEKSAAGLAIDPNVFRAFRIEAVPTFVASTAPAEACRGLGCLTATPAHDKMSGNISLGAALRVLASDGDQAAPLAAAALARLGS